MLIAIDEPLYRYIKGFLIQVLLITLCNNNLYKNKWYFLPFTYILSSKMT